MAKHDEHNVMLVESPEQVDRVNSSFYNRFPFPWQPASFYAPTDPSLYNLLLNQNLGAYQKPIVPVNADIWVAGCGTNQAVYTALRFPQARITGSDLSASSLAQCSETARSLGLTNLTLREESLHQAGYEGRFDYVICTGVIHHNADPAQALASLGRALKPSGVLELMVYNRYHRLLHQAFQRAVRLLSQPGQMESRNETELRLAYKLVRAFTAKNLMHSFLKEQLTMPEQQLADNLIQPVEYSYTVEALNELAEGCGMEMLLPCPNEYDAGKDIANWHIEFDDGDVQRDFDALPDLQRWQVANLLLLERSPMMWFYLQRRDSGRARLTEAQTNEAFLDTVFEPTRASQCCYLRGPSGNYTKSPLKVSLPSGAPHASVARIFARVDSKTPMRDIFKALNLETSFGQVSNARARLTSSMFPQLKVVVR